MEGPLRDFKKETVNANANRLCHVRGPCFAGAVMKRIVG
jgi:hypothetical protein